MAFIDSPKTRLLISVVLINAFVYLLAAAALYQSRLQYVQHTELSIQNLARSLELKAYTSLARSGEELRSLMSQFRLA